MQRFDCLHGVTETISTYFSRLNRYFCNIQCIAVQGLKLRGRVSGNISRSRGCRVGNSPLAWLVKARSSPFPGSTPESDHRAGEESCCRKGGRATGTQNAKATEGQRRERVPPGTRSTAPSLADHRPRRMLQPEGIKGLVTLAGAAVPGSDLDPPGLHCALRCHAVSRKAPWTGCSPPCRRKFPIS